MPGLSKSRGSIPLSGRTGSAVGGSGRRRGQEGRMVEKQSRVTLTEVARAAGVSLATASKVMNGRGEVRAQTRAQVAAVAREMGYTPHARQPAPRRRIVIV